MILCSKSVENVLLRLFFTGFERTGQGGKQYFDAIESFSKLPHSVLSVYADRPISWVREKTKVVKVGYLWFSYNKDDLGNVIINEVYDSQIGKIITEETKSNSEIIISESQLRNIIKESIKKVLNII